MLHQVPIFSPKFSKVSGTWLHCISSAIFIFFSNEFLPLSPVHYCVNYSFPYAIPFHLLKFSASFRTKFKLLFLICLLSVFCFFKITCKSYCQIIFTLSSCEIVFILNHQLKCEQFKDRYHGCFYSPQ